MGAHPKHENNQVVLLNKSGIASISVNFKTALTFCIDGGKKKSPAWQGFSL
jgi:hypothetical protein